MQPGPSEDSSQPSSPRLATTPHDDRHHGLHDADEPASRPSHVPDADREGSAPDDSSSTPSGRARGNPGSDRRMSQSSKLGSKTTSDATAEHDNASASKSKGKNRGMLYRTIARSKGAAVDGVHILDLPNELLTHVLSYLPAETLISAALVSHRFHELVTTPHAWRAAFLRYFAGDTSTQAALKRADTDSLVQGGQSFTRLTALASWRSEYILRTRLLRSLARGLHPRPPTSDKSSSRSRQATGVNIYDSKLPDVVDCIQGDFGNGLDGRRPRFRYATSIEGRAGSSDPANGTADAWAQDDHISLDRFDQDFHGNDEPYGMGAGEIVGTENSVDVSQPFGIVVGEGLPGGRVWYRPVQQENQREGFFLTWKQPFPGSFPLGVPYIDPEEETICSVWIAQNSNVPNVSNDLLGMLSGASSGVLTAYTLGTDGVKGERMRRGLVTARWALCPGVPIIGIKVDESYSLKRYGQSRVLVMVLNALGEVFYLKDLFSRPDGPLPEQPQPDEINRFAWRAGQSVCWGMIFPTQRLSQFGDRKDAPRSSWFGAGLSQPQLVDETKEIERFIRKRPKHIREMYHGWDMQRRFEVDFAGDDGNGAGESVVIFDRGIKDGMSLPLRATRFVRRQDPGVEAESPGAGGSPVLTFADSQPEANEGRTTREDFWMQSDFSFAPLDAPEVLVTAIDSSSFATLTVDEDPLLTLSASTTSSPSGSPAGPMPRPADASEIAGHRARLVAVGTNQGSVVLWDMRAPVSPSPALTNTVTPVQIIRTDSPRITCLALTALCLVHGGNDGLVQAWDPLGSSSAPLRTLNSRYALRARSRFVMADTSPSTAGYNYFVAGAVSLDPDPTQLRGMVSLGSLLRYWCFSSDAADQYKRSKRRWRRSGRGSNHGPGPDSAFHPGVGARSNFKGYIQDEVAAVQAARRADRRQERRLANRFGVGLLGPGATEEEELAYATLLSTETAERRNFGQGELPPAMVAAQAAAAAAAEAEAEAASPRAKALPADADLSEAIRRSLADDGSGSSPESFPIRYARAGGRRKSPPSMGTAAASGSGAADPQRSATEDDVQFALELSLAEERSRAEAEGMSQSEGLSQSEAWEVLGSEEEGEGGKGKGKAREE